MLCFCSVTCSTLFNSLPYSRNATYKHLPCIANNSIQIYSIYNHISLINMCLNYNLLEWIQFEGSKRGLKQLAVPLPTQLSHKYGAWPRKHQMIHVHYVAGFLDRFFLSSGITLMCVTYSFHIDTCSYIPFCRRWVDFAISFWISLGRTRSIAWKMPSVHIWYLFRNSHLGFLHRQIIISFILLII